MIRFYFLNDDGDVEEFTERVNLSESSVVLTSDAEQGAVGTSTITVDDPLGDWTITGHRWVYVLEDTADFDMVYWGYAADRTVRRMAPNVLTSRQWVITVTDINTLFGRRIMVGSDCNRPAETDVERLQWLTGTSEQNFIDDTALLSTGSPVDMDAVDYRYQYATQIYDDCSQASGKNWFLYPVFDGSDWVVGFWYDFGSSTEYSSDIRISNDLDDIDDVVTFAPGLATELTRDPSRVYSGVAMPYDGGTVYQQRTATATEFARRDTSAPMVNVKTATKANARAVRYLGTINTEEDVIKTSLILPTTQVNDVLAGQRIEAKYTHLPGYEDFSWMRVLEKTTTFLTPREYGVDLTLSAQVAPPAEANFLIAYAAGSATMMEDLSGHLWTLAFWSGDFCANTVGLCGAGPPVNQGMGMYYRAIVPGESTTVATFKPTTGTQGGIWVYEIGGCDMSGLASVNSIARLSNGGTATVSATATEDSVFLGGISFGKVNYDAGWLAGGLGATDIVSDVSGTELVNKSAMNDADGAPMPWNWLGYATGTGSLSIAANANAYGYGSGAYSCGWNIGTGGLLIPAPSGFSIIQSAFGGTLTPGAPFDVVLGSPPAP